MGAHSAWGDLPLSDWTIEDSMELYNIPHWGLGFFTVNPQGHLVVTPNGPEAAGVDLHRLVDGLVERGVQLPILLRFTDVVKKRVEMLVGAFQRAFDESGYKGRYRGVYPVKVNQQRHLVEDLVRHCAPYHIGLEAGSKPELLLAMALIEDSQALLCCNGYKDESYIETAMLAQKLGRNTVIVVEKLSEIETVIRVARRTGLRPTVGVRAKLARPGKGRWESSSGDLAKFGLTMHDIVQLVDRMRAAELLDCLKLLHFHIGSQIATIRTFKEALKEASRTYVELCRLGAPMGIMDVGGGLGVDYDGTRSSADSSMNYSAEEYAADVVWAMGQACDEAGLPHPDIVTESGRAMVAHHSVLVFDVVGVERRPTHGAPEVPARNDARQIREMREVYDYVNEANMQEAWHDALAVREEALQAYNLGILGLKERARVEHLYWQLSGRILQLLRKSEFVPEELRSLERQLADHYYCNFSLFQSVPDSWAIDQIFPCLPIHRLDEEPVRRAVIADLTCDSDGKIDTFVCGREKSKVLQLHEWREGERYLLAIPLVGAYQEILGDLHNLFGDTNAVHVSTHDDGDYSVDLVLEGDRVSDVLGYVLYSDRMLVRKVRDAAEKALRDERLTRDEARQVLNAYKRGLGAYTYLGEAEEL